MSFFRGDPLPPPGLAKDQTFYMIFLANFSYEHELRSDALFANEQSSFGATRDCSAAFFMFQPLVNNQEEFQFKPTPWKGQNSFTPLFYLLTVRLLGE